MIERQRDIIYFYPRELDHEQPRIKVPFLKALRNYNNLNNTGKKVAYLLKPIKILPDKQKHMFKRVTIIK